MHTFSLCDEKKKMRNKRKKLITDITDKKRIKNK